MAEPAYLDHIEHRRANGAGASAARPALRLPLDFNALFARYLTRPVARLMPAITTFAVLAALVAGWLHSDEGHLSPDSGTGYWLGIIGASAMLLLLIYPMRKRMPRLRFLGSVPFWFKTHMMLGILGPVLIVFHSNFKLGALNSNVAFFAMLIVAISGVFGRYIYGKIHLGLSGRKAAIKQILEDAAQMQRSLGGELPGGARIIADMSKFAETAMQPRHGALSSLLAMLALGPRSRSTRRRLGREARAAIKAEAVSRRWSRSERLAHEADVRNLLALYFAAIGKAAKFDFYERLFALWHVLHLPLFILLIAAALAHVLAVHLY